MDMEALDQKLDGMSADAMRAMLEKMAGADKGKEMLGDAKPADMAADDMRAMLKKMAKDEELAGMMGMAEAKGLRCPGYREAKALTDIPNLRGSSQQCCMNCANFKFLPDDRDAMAPMVAEPSDEGACAKHECQVNGNWVCDTWTKPDTTQDPLPVMIVDSQAQAKASGVEVKAIGDGRIHAYAAVWGDPEHTDLSDKKDYFVPATDFWDDKLPLPRPLTYHHGWEPATKAMPVVGKITELGADDVGKWFIAELDKAHKYAKAIQQLIARKALRTSSDSIPQYTRREAKANGAHEIQTWPLFGVTLTPIPLEPRMYPAEEAKAIYQSIGVDLQLPEANSEASPTEREGAASAANPSPEHLAHNEAKSQGGPEMDEQAILALMEKREKDKEEAARKVVEAKAAYDAEVERGVQAKLAEIAKGSRKLLFAAKAGGASVSVASKYDDMAIEDLAFLATLRHEAKAIGKSQGNDEEILRALAAKSFKAIEAGTLEAKAMEDCEAKANEVMQSNLANYGDEWVPTNFSSQLWLKVRTKSRLVNGSFIAEQEIPKGYESDTIPLESTDFTWYNVSQTTADNATTKTPDATITSSKHGTAQRVVTVGKLGARGEISGELDEDSIIDAIPNARRQMEADFPRELEFVLFNGDSTAATDNINGDGTPVSGSDYTTLLGIIRNALKNNSAANAYDMSAAIDSTKIVQSLYALLGEDGYLAFDDPTACRVFCDYQTWTKVLCLSDLLTVGNAGPNATISRGADVDGGIPIFGIKWYPSAGVKKAQATGIRHGTDAGNNTLGRAVLVRGDQWILRWKRRLKFETTRIPRADVTELVATARLGIGYFDTEASAIAYNI